MIVPPAQVPATCPKRLLRASGRNVKTIPGPPRSSVDDRVYIIRSRRAGYRHSVPFLRSVAAHRIPLLLALVSPDNRRWDCTVSTACTLLLIIRGGKIPVFLVF